VGRSDKRGHVTVVGANIKGISRCAHEVIFVPSSQKTKALAWISTSRSMATKANSVPHPTVISVRVCACDIMAGVG
jgi:hypothetical protein